MSKTPKDTESLASLITPGNDFPRFLSVSDVSKRYGWGRTTTYYLLAEGKLSAFRMGTRKLLISTESCEKYINSLKPAVIKSGPRPLPESFGRPRPSTGRPVGRPRKPIQVATTT